MVREPHAGTYYAVIFTNSLFSVNVKEQPALTSADSIIQGSPFYIDGDTYVGVQTQSSVAFYPALLTFSPQTVGTTSPPKTVKFANIGIVPVNISKIETGSAFAETNDCPATLPVGGNCTITVTFTPAFVGLTGGSVNVNDDALGGQQTSGLEGKGK